MNDRKLCPACKSPIPLILDWIDVWNCSQCGWNSNMKDGKLWHGQWKDYKKLSEEYDHVVSVCRYPPYRYYGSVKKTGVVDFRHLGPSAELHRWRRYEMESKRDMKSLWPEYAMEYEKELGNREIDGKADQEYNQIVEWLKKGESVVLLCTCKDSQICHRYLLYQNIIKVNSINPYSEVTL